MHSRIFSEIYYLPFCFFCAKVIIIKKNPSRAVLFFSVNNPPSINNPPFCCESWVHRGLDFLSASAETLWWTTFITARMPFRFLILFIWIPSLSGKALFTACWASAVKPSIIYSMPLYDPGHCIIYTFLLIK